jgi:hypothetical protein
MATIYILVGKIFQEGFSNARDPAETSAACDGEPRETRIHPLSRQAGCPVKKFDAGRAEPSPRQDRRTPSG